MNIMKMIHHDPLLLADNFKNFRKMCLKIYHLDPVKFILAPRLGWKAALKKTAVKWELLTDIDMLLMLKKELEEEYVMQFINMQRANNKYMKDYDKKKNHHVLNTEM